MTHSKASPLDKMVADIASNIGPADPTALTAAAAVLDGTDRPLENPSISYRVLARRLRTLAETMSRAKRVGEYAAHDAEVQRLVDQNLRNALNMPLPGAGYAPKHDTGWQSYTPRNAIEGHFEETTPPAMSVEEIASPERFADPEAIRAGIELARAKYRERCALDRARVRQRAMGGVLQQLIELNDPAEGAPVPVVFVFTDDQLTPDQLVVDPALGADLMLLFDQLGAPTIEAQLDPAAESAPGT